MNRHQRREQKVLGRKPTNMTSRDFMKYAVAGMAADGPEIVKQLRAAVGDRQHKPGEALDGLMQLAAVMELAMLQGDTSGFSKAAIAVLFLARDIAILEGVIKPMTDVPQA
jgi:hypothetical protein